MSSSRWLIVALTVSVLVNIVLAGFVIGRSIAFDGKPPYGAPHRRGVLGWMATLPEARRDELTDAIRDYRRTRPNFRQMRRAQAGFREAMLSQPLDVERLRQGLDDVNGTLSQAQKASHEALVTLLSELTLEERQALNEHLSTRRPGRGRPGA